jgi:hypothetical protein
LLRQIAIKTRVALRHVVVAGAAGKNAGKRDGHGNSGEYRRAATGEFHMGKVLRFESPQIDCRPWPNGDAATMPDTNGVSMLALPTRFH